MCAWSLNFRDLSVARGAYAGTLTRGLVPLSDGVGEVVEAVRE
jgi:NADPH:quinone reductase-like Zn-dependent oxidoreductase